MATKLLTQKDIKTPTNYRSKEFIDSLHPRMRDIYAMRLSGVTLREIGEKYGVTKERVRQLIIKAKRDFDNQQKFEAVGLSCSTPIKELYGLKYLSSRDVGALLKNDIQHIGELRAIFDRSNGKELGIDPVTGYGYRGIGIGAMRRIQDLLMRVKR